jgi:predicted phosphodiesterase
MLFAVLSDIHGRRSSMLQALALAREYGAERLVFLGDYVGYMGSDPIGVVETAMYLESEGAICLRGNHDQALVEVAGDGETPEFSVMNVLAQQGIVRDCQVLETEHLAWLASRPYSAEVGEVVFSHGAIPEPEMFRYPTATRTDVLFEPSTFQHVDTITRELHRRGAQVLCHGHTHRPLVFFAAREHREQVHQVVPNQAGYTLADDQLAVIDVGSAGAIRTSGPESFVLLDLEAGADAIRYVRF